MPFFRSEFDVSLGIYRLAYNNTLTGFRSKYVNEEHPATGNKIKGIQYDEGFWRSDREDNSFFTEPTLYDPSILHLDGLFQPGVGDNDDLLVEDVVLDRRGFDEPAIPLWVPVINHGHYYDGEKEYYLYSDDSITVYPEHDSIWISEITVTNSGGNTVDLEFEPKPGVPVLARTFMWDEEQGSYLVAENYRLVTDFTPKLNEEQLLVRAGSEILWENVSSGLREFIIDRSTDTVRFVFNHVVSTQVGRYLDDLVSPSSDELEAMELVGITFEQAYQEHHLRFAPVDRTMPVQIILENGLDIQEYTVVTELTEGGSNEVQIDYDLGTLRFGNTDFGGTPPNSYNIRAHYHKTVAIEYEPVDSRDTAEGMSTNINPIRRFTASGFVFLRQVSEEPASIVLTAELPEISEDYYGPLYVGNSFARLLATVTSNRGTPMEGQEVFFEIIEGPEEVTFGADTLASALSNSQGIARTLLNPPRSVNELGGITDEVLTIDGNSALFLDTYLPPVDNAGLFVFQVHTSDDILGIPKTDLLTFYEQFIQDQGTDSSQPYGPRIDIDMGGIGPDYSWIAGAYQDFIKWEILHRAFHDLGTPIVYDAADPEDLRVGKKTVIAVMDADAINPHTGTTPAFVPVQPTTYEITDSGTYVYFDETLPATGGLYKAYLVIGPTKVTVRAYTINQRNGQYIYSNTIDILIDIPEASKGLTYIDAINAVPSGLLGNSLNWDQEALELESVNITSSGLLPLGWRLRSSGITLASALDAITFLDINPLTSPADTISHEFEVE